MRKAGPRKYSAKKAYVKKTYAAKKEVKPKSSKKFYPSNSVGATLGGAIGGLIGGPPGSAVGAALGGAAQGIMRGITGYGDYAVQANSIVLDQDVVPMFKSGKNSTRVRHREFIQDIVTSAVAGAFNIDTFPIQPGDPGTFPWLSQLADCFEEYRMHGLVFEFKTTSGVSVGSTNTALGTVVLATQYNSLSTVFANKQQMENYEFACSTVPSSNVIHPVECAVFQNPTNSLYIRIGGVSTGDIRLYDMGKFSIATVGMQGTSVTCGELWVSYDVELFRPKQSDTASMIDHYNLLPGSNNIAVANPFGFPVPTAPSNTSDFGTVLGQTTITFPNTFTGVVAIIYQLSGVASLAGISPWNVVPSGGNVTPFNILSANTTNRYNLPLGQSNNYTQTAYFSVVQGGEVSFTGAAALPIPPFNGADLFIMTMPATLTN